MTVNQLLLHSFKLVLLSCWAEFGDHRMSIYHRLRPNRSQDPPSSLKILYLQLLVYSCLSCSVGFRREESIQRFVCSVGPFFFKLYCKRTVLGRYKKRKVRSSQNCRTRLTSFCCFRVLHQVHRLLRQIRHLTWSA